MGVVPVPVANHCLVCSESHMGSDEAVQAPWHCAVLVAGAVFFCTSTQCVLQCTCLWKFVFRTRDSLHLFPYLFNFFGQVFGRKDCLECCGLPLSSAATRFPTVYDSERSIGLRVRVRMRQSGIPKGGEIFPHPKFSAAKWSLYNPPPPPPPVTPGGPVGGGGRAGRGHS